MISQMPYRPPPPKLRMQGQQVPTSQALPRGQPISGPRVPPSTMIAQEGWPAPERRRQSGGLRGTTTDDTMTNMPPLSDPHTLPAPVQTPSRGFCLHQSQHSTSDQSPCHPYRCTHPLPPIPTLPTDYQRDEPPSYQLQVSPPCSPSSRAAAACPLSLPHLPPKGFPQPKPPLSSC